MIELCGKPDKHGKPCNMRRGHQANYHRHRNYENAVFWEINSPYNGKSYEVGRGRVSLGYALTRAMKIHDKVVINVTKQ